MYKLDVRPWRYIQVHKLDIPPVLSTVRRHHYDVCTHICLPQNYIALYVNSYAFSLCVNISLYFQKSLRYSHKCSYMICTHTLTLLLYTAPATHPLDLQVVRFHSSRLTFEWQKMESSFENGPISGYEVRLYVDSCYTTHIINNVSINSYTVEGVEPGVSAYGLSVAAVNDAGVGCHSPIVWLNTTLAMDDAPVSSLTCNGTSDY